MSNFTIAVTAGILLLVIIILLINNLIRKKNEVQNIFGSVDALLKKRYDLIPNLVSSVQKYMVHEKSLLTNLTELRAKAISPGIDQKEKIEIQSHISRSLDGILVAVEAYPDLKASKNFLQLQGALNEVEEQISAGRRAYNAAVTAYNNAVETIPGNLVAFIMGYKPKPVMEIPESERQNISIKELFKQ
jgi:LemA protein